MCVAICAKVADASNKNGRPTFGRFTLENVQVAKWQREKMNKKQYFLGIKKCVFLIKPLT
jgi:hypothetical protein